MLGPLSRERLATSARVLTNERDGDTETGSAVVDRSWTLRTFHNKTITSTRCSCLQGFDCVGLIPPTSSFLFHQVATYKSIGPKVIWQTVSLPCTALPQSTDIDPAQSSRWGLASFQRRFPPLCFLLRWTTVSHRSVPINQSASMVTIVSLKIQQLQPWAAGWSSSPPTTASVSLRSSFRYAGPNRMALGLSHAELWVLCQSL